MNFGKPRRHSPHCIYSKMKNFFDRGNAVFYWANGCVWKHLITFENVTIERTHWLSECNVATVEKILSFRNISSARPINEFCSKKMGGIFEILEFPLLGALKQRGPLSPPHLSPNGKDRNPDIARSWTLADLQSYRARQGKKIPTLSVHNFVIFLRFK